MELKNIITHTHQGKRDYQEDSFGVGKYYLLVADGVGGAARGDVASAIVAGIVEQAVRMISSDVSISLSDWARQLSTLIQQGMLDHAQEHEDCWGMGSTLAMLLNYGDQVASLHIGDSRVYRFSRKGTQLWRSKDHSLVQELIDAEVITEEQAATHPRRNVITRVFQAKESHSASLSVHVFDKIDEGDLFLICTDGVSEAWNDVALGTLVAAHEQDFKKLAAQLATRCKELSSDNNTFVLAEWSHEYSQAQPGVRHDKQLETGQPISHGDMIAGSNDLNQTKEYNQKDSKREAGFSSLSNYKKILRIGSLVVFLGAIIYIVYRMWLEWGDSISSILSGAD